MNRFFFSFFFRALYLISIFLSIKRWLRKTGIVSCLPKTKNIAPITASRFLFIILKIILIFLKRLLTFDDYNYDFLGMSSGDIMELIRRGKILRKKALSVFWEKYYSIFVSSFIFIFWWLLFPVILNLNFNLY